MKASEAMPIPPSRTIRPTTIRTVFTALLPPRAAGGTGGITVDGEDGIDMGTPAAPVAAPQRLQNLASGSRVAPQELQNAIADLGSRMGSASTGEYTADRGEEGVR